MYHPGMLEFISHTMLTIEFGGGTVIATQATSASASVVRHSKSICSTMAHSIKVLAGTHRYRRFNAVWSPSANTLNIDNLWDEGSAFHVNSEDWQCKDGLQQENSNASAVEACVQARQRRRIAQLEEKLQVLEAGCAVKEKTYNANDDNETTFESDISPSQIPCVGFTKKALELEYNNYLQMLKMLRQGANSAQGDDTSKLKTLVSEWVNREFKLDPPDNPDNKSSCGFTNDACGRLLCPAELDWSNLVVRTGIHDHSDGYIITDPSFPAFLYEKYTVNPDDLEEGLFKGKILVQGYKAVFTSPSSAKDIEGDGDGTDIIQNNRRAKKTSCRLKVKTTSTTSNSGGQLCTSLKDPPVEKLSAGLTDFSNSGPAFASASLFRKVFGRSRYVDLSNAAKANMSVNTLAKQRAQHDDAAFDSP
ncbi:hypothetical protein EDB19DRAFT_1824045 [Suillus lakei]|nr:hypothetical protein EDB19DRAFT_1824045 [Suillus lakei]